MVDPDFEFRQRQKSLHISTFTPAVGPTQPSIERTLGAFWPRANRPGREADHSFTSSAEVKYEWSCTFNPPIRLNAVFTEILPSVCVTLSRTSHRKRTCFNLHRSSCNRDQEIYRFVQTELSSYEDLAKMWNCFIC
jgi:hypothetical protein